MSKLNVFENLVKNGLTFGTVIFVGVISHGKDKGLNFIIVEMKHRRMTFYPEGCISFDDDIQVGDCVSLSMNKEKGTDCGIWNKI
jgi:hypothetical protein